MAFAVGAQPVEFGRNNRHDFGRVDLFLRDLSPAVATDANGFRFAFWDQPANGH